MRASSSAQPTEEKKEECLSLGRGGSVVSSVPCVRRVASSNPPLSSSGLEEALKKYPE